MQITLLEALQIGARNSFDYQDTKESVFAAALSLELERDVFRPVFAGDASSTISTDTTGDRTVSGLEHTAALGVSQVLTTGAELSAALAVDLVQLLTSNHASSRGITLDGSVAVPLLRGAGEHIVTEPLIQAQRNVVYAIWDFERFKKEYAVSVASNYLSVLRQLDSLRNSAEDYRSRIRSARRSRRLADAGRVREIDVDQAVQNELSARQRWIAARQNYQQQLDSFKQLLGLPVDARVVLDPAELEQLAMASRAIIDQARRDTLSASEGEIPAADAEITLKEPSRQHAGPLELDEDIAVELALNHRLDMFTERGEVYDAQREVVVAADALGAELTFFGSASSGEGRTLSSADLANARLRTDDGVYAGWFTLDLPLERTAEAVAYRASYITLEQQVRDVQQLEDSIKLQIRNELRDMLEARENLYIQALAVELAEKRVKSVNLFLEADRAEIRDLVEAQDDLLSAQNALTSAMVDYRIAELNIQRDMGLLEVNEEGLWREYRPEADSYAQQ